MRYREQQRAGAVPQGATLTELLVGITCLIILASLLIPALQMSREAMRRSQCANHLRQISLAVAQYEGVYKCFPQSQNHSGGFLVAVLPFMEQQALAAEVERFRDSGASSDRFNIDNPLYRCPSDQTPTLAGAKGGIAGSNYCGNSGSWAASAKRFDGIFRGLVDIGFGAGIVRVPDVTDGLTNTGCLSEWLRADHSFKRMRTVWNTPSSYIDDREAFAVACRGIPGVPKDFGWQGDPELKGMPWTDGNLLVTLYNHVCTPGAPSCFNGASVPAGAASVSSNHPSVVNVAFADGRVEAIGEDIDPLIWFAFGSIDGQEVEPQSL